MDKILGLFDLQSILIIIMALLIALVVMTWKIMFSLEQYFKKQEKKDATAEKAAP